MSDSLAQAILERGQFYFPAGTHYGNPTASVICDRCRRSGIPASVGFDRFDFCLPCVEAVATAGATSGLTVMPDLRVPRPLPTPRGFGEPVMTLMVQDMFEPPKTRMMQDMFRRGGAPG